MWEIIDNEGVIFSGTQEEMEAEWELMIDPTNPDRIEWFGDLKLIEIHASYK